MTVYIVTSGDEIIGGYTTAELAEQSEDNAREKGKRYIDVTPIELDKPLIPPTHDELVYAQVQAYMGS